MKRLPILVFFFIFLFSMNANSKTLHLTCKSESQTWPQTGKIKKGTKFMALKIDFVKSDSVKIYQGKSGKSYRGSYDDNLIKSVHTTTDGFDRDLEINTKTGKFTDRVFVISHGKQETAWIDKGKCRR